MDCHAATRLAMTGWGFLWIASPLSRLAMTGKLDCHAATRLRVTRWGFLRIASLLRSSG
ncbi:MAG: hypothetical protein LBE71_00810 [Dysgonamonadaceae bacterium]|nr:hypothetical protein [Dysgonamonadaceae bacterium]